MTLESSSDSKIEEKNEEAPIVFKKSKSVEKKPEIVNLISSSSSSDNDEEAESRSLKSQQTVKVFFCCYFSRIS